MPPSVTISASPATVNAGATVTLTVTAGNATQLTITGTDGSSYALAASGGTQKVSPATTTTYTATAVGTGGMTTANAVVTVNASAPTITIAASPATIAAGGSSTLTVTATNASQVTVTGSDGSSYTLASTGGTQSVSPSQTTTYTATATGSSGTVNATATVTVASSTPAPTVTISAFPTTINDGASSTLTVAAANATSVAVTGTDGSSYTLSPTGGTQPVSPTATTTYTAVATGAGGSANATATVTVTPPATTVTIAANPATIVQGSPSLLTVTATNATNVTVTGSDGSSYTLAATGGNQSVSPTKTTTYTATATGASGNVTATATVTVVPGGDVNAVQHVVFMLQENHTFDNYFGMLNVYRHDNSDFMGDDGNEYDIDGLVDCAAGSNPCTPTADLTQTVTNQDDAGDVYSLFKLKSTCIDDDSSDWLASYGDVNRYNFLTTRPINMDGFVHTAEGYATNCSKTGTCGGSYTDLNGQRAMGYYDQDFLNYYYYMASQFAVSDRWFSPVSSKSISNRIATFTGGTTQGLVKDPGGNDHLPQLSINNIFEALDKAKVSWKIYYTVTQGFCTSDDDCPTTGNSRYPATDFSNLAYSTHYIYNNPTGAACAAPTQPSSVVGDSTNSFCIDPTHIAPLGTPSNPGTYGYFADLTNSTLPSFAFIEAGYANNDEHPGSQQSILYGQAQVSTVINAFMSSPEWPTSVFFFSYDEGGGPYDHVPPVPGHSNDNPVPTAAFNYPDISSIAVNPDGFNPCLPPGGTPTTNCDLISTDPGANPGDAAAQQGFAAQLGFRVPNFVVSPFTRRHYVSHAPMDHTAIIRFVETRFIGPSAAPLTNRDGAQPNLLDFFDFTTAPWETPPSPPAPTPTSDAGPTCTPQSMGP
jgi:phospholipase C